MMPFYSYDIPHTCGPEPGICCQFDFRNLPTIEPIKSCPRYKNSNFQRNPVPINQHNVRERSEMLLDQYRKKAMLYAEGSDQSRVVLIPLGDDFRYDGINEANLQFVNYEKLFKAINNNPEMNTEIGFGTLSDYFDAVEKVRPMKNAPRIAGDFFSYSDVGDCYWTGYFNTRPFYKWFDRYLEHWIRATHTLMSIAIMKKKLTPEITEKRFFNFDKRKPSSLFEKISHATRVMDLFQHHDAISGTGTGIFKNNCFFRGNF